MKIDVKSRHKKLKCILTAIILSVCPSVIASNLLTDHSDNKAIPINKNITKQPITQAATLLISYHKYTNIESIKEIEMQLPAHTKKSLNSQVMYLYKFHSEEYLQNALKIFKKSEIVNTISKNRFLTPAQPLGY